MSSISQMNTIYLNKVSNNMFILEQDICFCMDFKRWNLRVSGVNCNYFSTLTNLKKNYIIFKYKIVKYELQNI